MCSSLPSVRVAVPPSLLRRYSALPHTVALHVVALLIAVVVVAPILIGSLRGCRRIVPRSSLHSLAVVCAPPLIVVPSLLSGAVLDGTAIPPISHLNPLPRMRSAPVLPPTSHHWCLQLRERCTVERHLRLPTSAQARVSPRLSASPPRLHHWQRQNRNRLEACNLCNVRNFEGWELVTCVIRHLLDIHRGSLPAAKHLLGIHPVEACRRQSTCLGCRG